MSEKKYKTIGEVAKELNLIDSKTGNLQTHTLRYWESQFKQIKPKVMAGKRRYYTSNDFEIIKKIKYLLKEEGLTIKGVKKILSKNTTETIDVNTSLGVYNPKDKSVKSIKNKAKNIYKIIKELKDFN